MFYVQGKFNFFKSGKGGVFPPPLPPSPLATRLANGIFIKLINVFVFSVVYIFL